MALETTLTREFQKAIRAKALGMTIEEYEEGLRSTNYFKQLNFIKSWQDSEKDAEDAAREDSVGAKANASEATE